MKKILFSIVIWGMTIIAQYYFYMFFTYYTIQELSQNSNLEYFLGDKISQKELEQKFEIVREKGCKSGRERYCLKEFEEKGKKDRIFSKGRCCS